MCTHREDDGLVACIVSLDLVGVNSETADDLRSAAQGAVSKIMQACRYFIYFFDFYELIFVRV